MLGIATFVMANLTVPEEIGTNPQSLLLLLPIAAAIAVVYKATKLQTISAGSFLKESVVLFCSIIAFMVASALVLWGVAWLLLE
jgi:hypothetical protein